MENSPFNRLSAEIRNIIFALALKADRTLQLLSKDDIAEPPLTRTCKQIRTETLLVFYAVNNFHVELRNISITRRFSGLNSGTKKASLASSRLDKLGDSKRKAITSLKASIFLTYVRIQEGLHCYVCEPLKGFAEACKKFGMACGIRCDVEWKGILDVIRKCNEEEMKKQLGEFGLGVEFVADDLSKLA